MGHRSLPKQTSGDWEPWSDDVRAEFEAVAPPRAGLIYELCLGTEQRIGAVVTIRWGHIYDGVYEFTQGKTDKTLWIPLTDRLRDHLATDEKNGLMVVMDKRGRPVH